ncbi:MAG: hypothetical protein KGL18_02530 [Burkholderiales bacterium]|nr:hypothetical protein [Burkholderiales bacterium]MDE1926168.1 hypothetical protein [Burkholderiales bacterium]MDE2158055.1 hypothetical protein [Burkholderiales bacterium]MDE2501844.1 hypothetical protein [Burkholderiales bacterium]
MHYRYGSAALKSAPAQPAQTLYVVGGLYGNRPALDAVESMAAAEAATPVLCFNGDFNWFNVDDAEFEVVNRRVLAHAAILGNVEAELLAPGDDAGCGCAYPDQVDDGVVERSNRIHARLAQTAARHPDLLGRIARLPMLARYEVAGCRIGVVHGDAESLAGWEFGIEALDDPARLPWLLSVFSDADVDVFASTHTCLPVMRRFAQDGGRSGWVANNGAAGMPNFKGDLAGLCTRIAATPSPHPVLQEIRAGEAFVALLPVRYAVERWQQAFLAQWPAHSPAWTSYFARITYGPAFTPDRALA